MMLFFGFIAKPVSIFTLFQVISILANHLHTLKKLFDVFADSVEGVSVVKLTTSAGNGVLRILECYEVIPSYLTKIEVKVLFSLIAHSQVSMFQCFCLWWCKIIHCQFISPWLMNLVSIRSNVHH